MVLLNWITRRQILCRKGKVTNWEATTRLPMGMIWEANVRKACEPDLVLASPKIVLAVISREATFRSAFAPVAYTAPRYVACPPHAALRNSVLWY